MVSKGPLNVWSKAPVLKLLPIVKAAPRAVALNRHGVADRHGPHGFTGHLGRGTTLGGSGVWLSKFKKTSGVSVVVPGGAGGQSSS